MLEASGRHVYGFGSDFDSREPRFMTSSDQGHSWETREPPEPMLSLAISPANATEIVASGEQRVYRSSDGGRRWRPVNAPAGGLLTWNRHGLFLAPTDGRVWHAESATSSWTQTSDIGGQPAAWDSGPDGELLAALHDGTVKQSDDAGATWSVRSQPS